jgi:hypothetical protein
LFFGGMFTFSVLILYLTYMCHIYKVCIFDKVKISSEADQINHMYFCI